MQDIALFIVAAAFANAQSPYAIGPVWWNAGQGGPLPWEESYENTDGLVSILNKNGAVHTDGQPFFESLGTNHRACVTCHQPSDGMSLSVATLHERWTATEGRDPVFAAIDGSNCPDLPQGAASSHSLLLDRGLIRIALPWPPKAGDGSAVKPDFRIDVVRDPTGCNLSALYGLKSKAPAISVFRRPRMAANLNSVVDGGFALMADGREPSLRTQAITAILTHEQAAQPPSDEQLRRIIDFETQIYAAQGADIRGGLLNEKGGPLALGTKNLANGPGASLGSESARALLVSFKTWQKRDGEGDLGLQREFRASVARGAVVFFTKRFGIRDGSVSTCASCHGAGADRWVDIRTTNQSPEESAPELPLFRITCDSSAPPHPVLGRVFYSQDPGRALISGKCADAGAIVPQQLRALAARAPYFSNGSARDLEGVVDFYDKRFGIGFTEEEKRDLTNFLRVL